MSVKPLDISAPGFVSTYSRIAIPISINISQSSECKNLCSFNKFFILDSVLTNLQLKIKEALHIDWERPALNKQLKHVSLTLLL